MELIAIVISALSLILTIIHIFISRVHDRKKDTLDAYNQLQVQALDILNGYTKSEIEQLKRSNKNEDYRIVSSCLARVEHFCVGINQKIYDRGVLEELAGPYFLSIYKKLRPIIDKKHEGFNNKNFYENFEKVADFLEKKASRQQ